MIRRLLMIHLSPDWRVSIVRIFRRLRPLSLVWLAIACVDKSIPVVPQPPQDALLRSITVEPQGVTMAVGDRLPLLVKSQNILGDDISADGEISVKYLSSDTTTVTVDAAGNMTALRANASVVPVEIRVTNHGVTKVDSAFIRVNTMTEPVTGVHLQLMPGDSSHMGMGVLKPVQLIVTTGNGQFVSDAYVHVTQELRHRGVDLFGSKGVLVAQQPGFVLIGNLNVLGDFWIYASSTIYGVPLRDSIQFVGLHRAAFTINIQQDASDNNNIIMSGDINGQTNFVQPCAAITFKNSTTNPIAIEFDDPGKTGACGTGTATGNISPILAGRSIVRKFPETGFIRWTVTRTDGSLFRTPATGVIEVR